MARRHMTTGLSLFTTLAVAASGLGCQSASVRREVHVRESALLLPESLAAAEPRADRVTLLIDTGRTRAFEDVVIGRDGDRIVVQGVTPGGLSWPIGEVRAIQIERDLVGPDRQALVARDAARPDVQVTPGWGIVLGVVGVIAGSILVVTTLGED